MREEILFRNIWKDYRKHKAIIKCARGRTKSLDFVLFFSFL
jgi:hypothetical protein